MSKIASIIGFILFVSLSTGMAGNTVQPQYQSPDLAGQGIKPKEGPTNISPADVHPATKLSPATRTFLKIMLTNKIPDKLARWEAEEAIDGMSDEDLCRVSGFPLFPPKQPKYVPIMKLSSLLDVHVLLSNLNDIRSEYYSARKEHPYLFGGPIRGTLGSVISEDGLFQLVSGAHCGGFRIVLLWNMNGIKLAYFGNKTLTKQEEERLEALLPNAKDTPEKFEAKLSDIHSTASSVLMNALKSFEASGYETTAIRKDYEEAIRKFEPQTNNQSVK